MSQTTAQAVKEALESQFTPEDLAQRYFSSYIHYQIPHYLDSPHNEMIAAKLQMVESGAIRRLIICMPPRHGKTMQTSELFPAWYLGRNPKDEIIHATYSYERGSDVGRKVRNHIISPAHSTIFPECLLSPDVKGANKMATVAGGYYYSVGAAGAIVGRGANLFLIDDPIKSRQEAESERYREEVRNWYRAQVYTRLMPNNRIVIIMTRWHYDDLVGWLLSREDAKDWHQLVMPAIAEGEDEIRRQEGDALWEDFYPKKVLYKIRSVVGTREWNAQYQQTPTTSEDAIFDLDWFDRYDYNLFRPWLLAIRFKTTLPGKKFPFNIKRIVQSWDTAYKDDQINDPSSCTIWGISPTRYYLLHRFNKRMQYPEIKKKIKLFYKKWTVVCRKARMGPITVLIEDKASGQSLVQELKRDKMPVIGLPANTDKLTRANSSSGVVEAGLVSLPKSCSWSVPFETQITQFPFGREKDDVDSMTQFLNWHVKPKFKRGKLRLWK
jgi:predicted phage terminase large subunit-like protein